jgi:hypothetical protein
MTYAVAAASYEPFVTDPYVAPVPDEWFIERVQSSELNGRIDGWKALARCGWDVTALIAPDSRTVVALGCRSRG